MVNGITILLVIIVLLVAGGIALALYGTGSLERWGGGDMEHRR
jgi:hypothetical protein